MGLTPGHEFNQSSVIFLVYEACSTSMEYIFHFRWIELFKV